MLEGGLDAAIELILSGPGSGPLLHLLAAAQGAARAPIAYVTILRDDEVQLVAAAGFPIMPFGSVTRAEPGVDAIFDEPMLVEDLTRHPVLKAHPLVTPTDGWRWFSATPIPLPMLRHRVALCCADPRLGVARPPRLTSNLASISVAVADTLTMLSVIAAQSRAIAERDRRAANDARPAFMVREDGLHVLTAPSHAEPASVTMRFLLSTLIGQRRMLERDGITYHALSRWRAAIKPWQIDALQALKSDPPTALTNCIARELAIAAVDVHGPGSFDAVVPVACGNSGNLCLAHQLAQAVAEKLNVAFVPAFDRIDTTGSSHPRRNATRPSMTLRKAPAGRVLLIDDVATSGAHIAEAAKMLRKTAQAVLPLVWIGAR